MSEPVLRIKGLRKSFGSLVVTDDVSLDVMPGEMLAVIGPNGAGKTTLINQISGLLPPDAGTIMFDGADVTALPPQARALRGLARSFQITSILPSFSVLENVALAVQARIGSSLRFFGCAAAEAKLNQPAMAALEQTGIADRAHVQAGELSHGEKRALELAIALAMQPALLLLDEPMAGIGREETDRQIELLLRLKGKLTMVLVEHDMSAVFALADRISVLIRGRVLRTGLPADVRADQQIVTAYLGEQME
ncbi:MAG TPA: ABC transporter ATP-binding protein [Xanthobacteraceae bacterium]|nr:ABC transporter ATP-binding protein [Xanthobacteraceae bacterium]